MECIFCKIIKKEIPSYTIYEDDKVLVFLDIHPNSNGHTLIIPKKHSVCLEDISDNDLEYIHKISKEIYALLMKKLKPSGITLVQNNGVVQDVKHYHLHLIPKYKASIDSSVEEVYKKIIN